MQARRVVRICVLIAVVVSFPGCVVLVVAYTQGSLNRNTFALMLRLYAFIGVLGGAGVTWAILEGVIAKAKHEDARLATLFSSVEYLAVAVLMLGGIEVLMEGLPGLIREQWLLWPCILSGGYIYLFRTTKPDAPPESKPPD